MLIMYNYYALNKNKLSVYVYDPYKVYIRKNKY
jgi:hypothetical protein